MNAVSNYGLCGLMMQLILVERHHMPHVNNAELKLTLNVRATDLGKT